MDEDAVTKTVSSKHKTKQHNMMRVSKNHFISS
jgi:hypothetical protein